MSNCAVCFHVLLVHRFYGCRFQERSNMRASLGKVRARCLGMALNKI